MFGFAEVSGWSGRRSGAEGVSELLNRLVWEVAIRPKGGLAGVSVAAGNADKARVVTAGGGLREPQDEGVATTADSQGAAGVFGRGHFI